MDKSHNSVTRTLETAEFQSKLLAYIMQEYDNQSFQNPIARMLVEDLMQDGFNSMTDQQLRETAAKWFPEKFPL